MRLNTKLLHPGKSALTLCAGAAVTLGLLSAPAIAHGAGATPQSLVSTEAVAGQSAAATAKTGPNVQWDWTMPTNIVDEFGWDFPNQQLAGPPDGLPDDVMSEYTTYQGASYRPGEYGQYGKIPTDGLHKVVLDGSGSTGEGTLACAWKIYSNPVVKAKANCADKTTVHLPEGTHKLQLKVTDKKGTTKIKSKIKVKNVLIALLGDSYAVGVGFPPYRVDGITGPNSTIAFDDPGCARTRWGGFVRAAQAAESADPRSNVTFINVGCGGAQVAGTSPNGGGVLTPQNTGTGIRPAQIDQLDAIVGPNKIDVALVGIGGNDTGFGGISATCVGALAGADLCYNADNGGDELWDWTNKRLEKLTTRYDEMAACLTSGAGTCQTSKSVGDPKTDSTRLNINDPAKVIQSGYPSLITRAKKAGETGNGSEPWVYCAWKPTPAQPMGADTYGQAPAMPWDAYWALNSAYLGEPGDQYVPPGSPDPAAEVGPLTAKGLTQLIKRNGSLYGYTVALDIFTESLQHGACATAPGMEFWVNGISTGLAGAPQDGAQYGGGLLHPSEAGQQAYADGQTPQTLDQAGIPVKTFADKTKPGKVRTVRLAPKGHSKSKGELRVTWKKPKNTGGGTINKYRVRISKAGDRDNFNSWKQTKQKKRWFKGLDKTEPYWVQIQAKSSVGWGERKTKKASTKLWNTK
ncbi:MAG: fibronectin type III domain-containing protein [Actinomycetia bacterium]|nr:fibronectin type III domain-containing protein [Actinomycetes bacterium]